MSSSVNPRSVLHIGKFYPPHNGGIETHVYELARRQKEEMEVGVVVAHGQRWTRRECVDGVRVTRCGTLGSIASMPICIGMAGAIRNAPADVVHLHVPNPGAALAFLLSGHKGKLVVTHHADTLGRRFLRRLSDPFVRAAMDRASAIIVTSARYMATSPELERYREKCRVIPLAIDPSFYAAISPESDTIRRRFDGRLILAVGRMVPYKGFRYAIEAMQQVEGHLCIIGSGPEEASLQQLASELKVTDKVTFMGRAGDLRPYYQAASAFVLPSISRAEAFGMVQLEAMASGTPIINTNIDSGVPEVAEAGVSAITVPPGNAEALAGAMRALLGDPELRSRLGRRAQDVVREKYALDPMVRSTFALYREVLGA